MTSSGTRVALTGGATAALALLITAPAPAHAVRLIGSGATSDPTAPIVGLASLGAWALAAWLVLTVVLTTGARVPGRLGRLAQRAGTCVAPAVVRRTVEVALGLSVVVGAVGAAPAAASPGSPAAAPGLDWAATSASDATPPSLDWAGAAAQPAVEPPSVPATADGPTVVVTAGDSLWALAAADLSARTGVAPSDAQVARAWPSWWAANRDVVGHDPHLIRPGTALTPPTAASPSS